MKKADAYKILTAPPKKIEWRIGSKTKDGTKVQVLPYIDARAAMDVLDEIALFSWDTEMKESSEGVICRLRIRFDDGEAVREEGAGYPVGEDDKLASDMRLKGAISDAFKRAVHAFGYARQLYHLEKVYIPVNTPIYKFKYKIDWENGKVNWNIDGEDFNRPQNFAQNKLTPAVTEVKQPEVQIPSKPAETKTVAEQTRDYYQCDGEGCGQKISQKVAEYSLRLFHQHLCMKCQDKAKAKKSA